MCNSAENPKTKRGGIRRRAGVALLLMPVLLTACSLPSRKAAQAMQTYLLQAAPTEQAQATSPMVTACFDLGLNRPTAGPGFDTPRMAYVDQPHRLNYFAYHQWVDLPARMLGTALQQGLESKGLFRVVMMLPAPVPMTFDLRLDSQLMRLQQVFIGDTSHVVLAVRVTLTDMVHRRLMASRVFVIQEPATERNPYAGVMASNRAMGQFMRALFAFLRTETARLPSNCGAESKDAP